MKTALFTFIVGRSSFIELKNAGRLRTAFISIACMRYRRGRPGKASRYALRASRSVVVSLSLSRRNTTSESEETAMQPLSQLR